MRPFSNLLSHLAVLALCLGLAAAFYAPPAHFGAETYFGTTQDPVIDIWFLNWPVYAFAHHAQLLSTSLAFAPHGLSLAWKTNLFGLSLPLAPLTQKLGAFAVYNLLMLISPGLACFAAYLAAFELSGAQVSSLAAGVVFGFSGYELGQLLDHLNLAFTLPVPLSLWLVLAGARRGWPGWCLTLGLGAVLAWQFAISQEAYAGLVVFGMVAIAIVFYTAPHARHALARIMPAILAGLTVSVVAVFPLIWAMITHFSDAERNVAPARDYSTDLLNFLLPTPLYWLGGSFFTPLTNRFVGNFGEQSAYLGLPLLALLVFLWRMRRHQPVFRSLLIFLAITAVASLGPFVHLLGLPVSPAPWMLIGWLPFIKSMLPMRFMLFAWLALALLLALWLAEPEPGRMRRWAWFGVIVLFLFPARAFDRNWTALATPHMLLDGSIPAGKRLLILPEARYEMGYQYASGMKYPLVAQGYLSSGVAPEFDAWPFYRTVSHPSDQQFIGLIQPGQFNDFLLHFDVQAVVVTAPSVDQGNETARMIAGDGFPLARQSTALSALLKASGWRVARQDPDATLFLPPPGAMPPSQVQIAADLAQPRPDEIGNLALTRARIYQVTARLSPLLHVPQSELISIADWYLKIPPEA
jgi:hypothetical protein